MTADLLTGICDNNPYLGSGWPYCAFPGDWQPLTRPKRRAIFVFEGLEMRIRDVLELNRNFRVRVCILNNTDRTNANPDDGSG